MWWLLLQTDSFGRAKYVWNRDGQMGQQMVTLNQKYDSNLHLKAENLSCASSAPAEVYPRSRREDLGAYTHASKLWGHSNVVPLDIVLG